ncbi:MAG TPA: RHS repeat-associated core domain-containing protein, partial [bacterium]|nr:RHS repeat-associated core domain-containing protein [bacterium]
MDNHIAIQVFTGTGSNTYFFLTDERGNVVALTDEDGTILERYRYRVYGEHEILTSNFDTKNNNCYVSCDNTYQSCFENCDEDPTCEAGCLSDQSDCYDVCDSNPDNIIYAGNVHNFLWGGSLYEPETNLYWMRNRYYHKDMHRFINQDPIGIWGDANNLGNGFAYVAGMVIEASDPTGLEVTFEGAVLVAATGAIAGIYGAVASA